MKPAEALQRAAEIRSACAGDPGLWNLLQAEYEWALYGDACDPLSASAPERALKALQRDIYLEVWADRVATLPGKARILVAGGGTGRFAQILVRGDYRIDLVEISPEAARRARRHLGSTVRVTNADVSEHGALEAAAYDLVLAVEVACYASEPRQIMDELRNALRPGGTLLFSVEARPGALLADRDLASPRAFQAVMTDGLITLPGLKHVHYYTRAETIELAEQSGFAVQAIEGVCYVPDGPFHALVDAARLEDREHREQLLEVERRCRQDALLRELPRAWAAVASAV